MNGYESREERTESSVQINMSPLIDCVFLLLIFFVATTVFVDEAGVEVEKPRAVSAKELDRQSIQIALTQDGRIIYGGREVSLNSVRAIVARELRQRDVPVILIADKDSRTGPLVALIDECKLGGARQVNVSAVRQGL